MTKQISLTILLTIITVAVSIAQSVTLVKDLTPGTASSNLSNFTSAFGVLFFSDQSGHLWSSDGTAMGTVLVDPDIIIDKLFFENSKLFSSAAGIPFEGFELYKFNSFGDLELVKDINQTGTFSSYPSNFKHLGTTLLFEADDGVHGRELWKSDGTTGGTELVKDISPGSGGARISFPVVLNNLLYFSAYDPTNGYALWKTDGTGSGTQLVKDCNLTTASLSSGAPRNLTVINSTLYFSVDDGVHGEELWTSDGTTNGTQLVKDLTPGAEGVPLFDFLASNGLVFFKASNFQRSELWVTDGTSTGTLLLKSFEEIQSLVHYNGKFFVNNRAAVNPTQLELWTSDGTVAGTTRVSEKAFVGDQLISNQFYKVVNKEVPLNSGFEIIKSEGTECRTKTVASVSSPLYYVNYLAVGTKLFINAFSSSTGLELFVYDTSTDPGFSCQSQSITFASISDQIYGTTYGLTASASSGLPLSYSFSDGTLSELENSTLTFTGVGTFFITANQNGNNLFDPAPAITRQVTIVKSDQSIDFPLISSRTAGTQLQLSAVASSDLVVSFAITSSDKVTLAGTLISFVEPGVVTITASQAGSPFYNAAPNQSQTICINPKLPTITSDRKLDGATLSSSNATGNQWYKDGSPIGGAIFSEHVTSETGTYSVETIIEGCASGKSALFPVIVTGIELNASVFPKMYPNPASDQLVLEGLRDSSEIRIFDMLGRVQLLKSFRGSSLTIDVSDYLSGFYIIEVQDSLNRYMLKFVKK